MTTKQKTGQRFGLGFSGTKVSPELRRLVKEYKVGNVILFRENLESAVQARELCDEIRELILNETGLPPFIAIDQEGGCVVRLPKDMVNVPGAMALAAAGSLENISLAAEITAAELKRIGVNMNLAPVLDVNNNRDNPAIGNRSFSPAASETASFAAEAVRAYGEAGLLCCGKHFPGHGDTALDSHLALPVVNRGIDELEERELIPFRSAIAAGIPAIMTTHILFPKLEPEKLPATMSANILQGLLRQRMGFEGLIISDGMEMKAVKDHYGVSRGCVLAVSAGVDIVFVCHESEDMEASLMEVNAALDEGRLDAAKFDASVERILRYREQYASYGSDVSDENGADIKRLKEKNDALTRGTLALSSKPLPPLGSKPFFAGCLPYRSTIASAKPDSSLSFARWFNERLSGGFLETPVNPDTAAVDDIVSNLPEATSVVLGTYNGHLNKGQMALARALFEAAEKRGINFICAALRNPWDLSLLPEEAYGIALWEYTEKSFEAALAAFKGGFIPSGKITRL